MIIPMIHDAGLTKETNSAVVECLEHGITNACSILCVCKGTRDIVDYAKQNPQFDWGLHFTVSHEWSHYPYRPVSQSDQVESLTNKIGNFSCQLNKYNIEDIETEMKSQIEFLLSSGVQVRYIDFHTHFCSTREDVIDLYLTVPLKYGIKPIVVNPSNPRILQRINDRIVNRVREYISDNGLFVFDDIVTSKHLRRAFKNIEHNTGIIFHPSYRSRYFRKNIAKKRMMDLEFVLNRGMYTNAKMGFLRNLL